MGYWQMPVLPPGVKFKSVCMGVHVQMCVHTRSNLHKNPYQGGHIQCMSGPYSEPDVGVIEHLAIY